MSSCPSSGISSSEADTVKSGVPSMLDGLLPFLPPGVQHDPASYLKDTAMSLVTTAYFTRFTGAGSTVLSVAWRKICTNYESSIGSVLSGADIGDTAALVDQSRPWGWGDHFSNVVSSVGQTLSEHPYFTVGAVGVGALVIANQVRKRWRKPQAETDTDASQSTAKQRNGSTSSRSQQSGQTTSGGWFGWR